MESSKGICSIKNPNDPSGCNLFTFHKFSNSFHKDDINSAPPKTFTFDGAYFMDSTTEQIYNEIVYPLVEV